MTILPSDVDAAPLQLLVVARHAVVDVDELAGHVAVDRVGVVDRELLARFWPEVASSASAGSASAARRRGAPASRRSRSWESGTAPRRSRSAFRSPRSEAARPSTRRWPCPRASRRGAAGSTAARPSPGGCRPRAGHRSAPPAPAVRAAAAGVKPRSGGASAATPAVARPAPHKVVRTRCRMSGGSFPSKSRSLYLPHGPGDHRAPRVLSARWLRGRCRKHDPLRQVHW